MAVSTPLISFSDGVGKDIDDFQFRQHFFKNLRGAFNQPVNAFARTRIVDSPNEFQYVYPTKYNKDPEVTYTTSCCNKPGVSVVVGRKIGYDPTEEATLFRYNIQLPVKGVARTTRIFGLDQTEN